MRRVLAIALAIMAVAQAAVVTIRRSGKGDGGAALRPGAERVVSDELLSEGRVTEATVIRSEFRPRGQSLYGEAGRDDPLAGRMLSVGTAFDDAVPVFPGEKTPGFRTLDLAGRRVAVGKDRTRTWVTWDLPDCTDECQGYVAGRNVSEDEVLEAARGATVDRAGPAIAADALPAGVSLLFTVAVDLDGFDAPGEQVVSWRDGDGAAVLRVAPDPRMATAFRFWVDGGPVRIRGQAGSAGPLARLGAAGGLDLRARAWSEGGRALLVVTNRRSSDDDDRFVRGLRTADAGEWDRLRSRVLDVDSDTLIEECNTSKQSFTAVGRHEGRFRWAVGFPADDRSRFASCRIILTPDRRSLGSSGGPHPVPGGLSVLTSGIGGATDPIGLFVTGVAPPGTARVRAELPGGRTVDAELAGVGPRPGERYYALFVEGDVRRKPAVVAVDASGVELVRVPGGDPT